MTTTHASPLTRLTTPIIKPTIALIAALAIGGAWADITWTGQGGDSNWETAENWSAYDTTTGMTLDHSGVSGAYEIDISSNPTRAGYIWVPANNGVTLKASGTYGLNQTDGDIRVGTWNNGKLTIDGGTHAINSLVVASGWWNNFAPTGELNVKGGAVVTAGWNALGDTDSDTTKSTHNPNSAGTLNVENATLSFTSDFLVGRLAYGTLNVNNGAIVTCQGGDSSARWTIVGEQATGNGTINLNYGGVLAVWHIQKGGGSATVNFNGGTLKTLGNTGNCEYIIGNDGAPATGPTVNISANGGVFDSNGLDTKVGVAVTGAGTITKKGTGTLTFTGDLSGFVGRVAVASGAGSVTLPATASRARAGDYTSVVENQDGTFTFAYDSTGSAAATATAEILNLDFEGDDYGNGWVFSSDGYGGGERHSQSTRELYEEVSPGVYKTSKFLMLEPYTGNGNRGSKASYSFSNVFDSLDEYRVEFDYFAGMCYSDYSYLELNTADGRIVYLYTNYDAHTIRQTIIYLNGSSTQSGTFASADRNQYPDNVEHKGKWVHVILTATREEGVKLRVQSADRGNDLFSETFVTDFAKLSSMAASARNKYNSATSASGIDNVVITAPATVSVDGTNYRTFAEAVAAATSTSTITLYSDVELATSVELPYGATLNLNGNILYTTDPDVAVTLDDGVHYLESVTAGGVKTFSNVVTMDDTVYVWTGDADNTWGNSNNWKIGGSVAANAPTASDEVLIPAEGAPWTINVASDASVSKITVNGATTFSGGTLRSSRIDGAGKITLNGASFGPIVANGEMSVYNDLQIVGNNNIYLGQGNYTAVNVHLYGDLTGSGNLSADHAKTQGKGVQFHGDNADFYGTFSTDNYNSRDYTAIIESSASSSNAVWRINTEVASGQQYEQYPVSGNGVYHFGAFIGGAYYAEYKTDRTTVIGWRSDVASEYVHRTRVNRPSGYVKKVGSGVLTFSGYPYTLTLEGGTTFVKKDTGISTALTFAGDDATLKLEVLNNEYYDPSAVIKNSTSAIAFDSNGSDYTWSSALASSNVGGLVKKGAGTLTLSAVPAYTGTTKVEAGALYVVEGDWTPALDPATAEVASDMVGYRKFIPSTLSVSAPVIGAYGADFATVDVTANVDSTYASSVEITYTLKTNGVAAASTTVAGNATSVTFSDVDISGLTRYADVEYTVEASGENVTPAASTASTKKVADAMAWVDEKKSTTGTTGSWKTADGEAATVTYDNETEMAALSDNKFSAANCSTGDVVTVTIKDVVYTALSDTSEVDANAQGSIALGGTELVPKFVVLTKSNDTVQWSEAEGVTPAFNTAYTIVFTFDYNNSTYSLTVNGTPLTVGGSATYGIVKTDNKFVKDIDFLGAGSIKAIEGVQYEGKMAVDQDGVRYATVQEAVAANAGKKGATVTLLHDTANTSFTGWKYDAKLKTFIWSVCGVMFLIF